MGGKRDRRDVTEELNILTLKKSLLQFTLFSEQNPSDIKRKHLSKLMDLSLSEPADELFWHKSRRKAITATFCGTVSGR